MDSFVFGTLIFFFPMTHLVPSKSCKASPSFTKTCTSRMAHRFRQTSIIFRQVEILLAHRRSKWTNSEASNSNISIYYAFNVHLLTKNWQTYACLNSQNYHPPHDTPVFNIFLGGLQFTWVYTSHDSSAKGTPGHRPSIASQRREALVAGAQQRHVVELRLHRVAGAWGKRYGNQKMWNFPGDWLW